MFAAFFSDVHHMHACEKIQIQINVSAKIMLIKEITREKKFMLMTFIFEGFYQGKYRNFLEKLYT